MEAGVEAEGVPLNTQGSLMETGIQNGIQGDNQLEKWDSRGLTDQLCQD